MHGHSPVHISGFTNQHYHIAAAIVYTIVMYFLRGNSSRAMELYEKAIKFARTKAEMAQACIAKELIAAQERARIEFGISAQEMTESFREGF